MNATRKNIGWIEDLFKWCATAPERQAGSAKKILQQTCKLRGIPTTHKGYIREAEDLKEAVYERYADLDTSRLPTVGRYYKAPELHSSTVLCGLGDMLLQELMKIHEAPNRRDKALLTNFKERCAEDQEEADLQAEKEILLAKIVEWELMLLDNPGFSTKETLSTPKRETMHTRSKVSLTPSPRKVEVPEDEDEDSEDEDSEEGSEYAVEDLLSVGFNPLDGTPVTQVLWADGSNTWESLNTMRLQVAYQERLRLLWEEAGVGKKNRVVITPPGEPIPCHKERGFWREHLPFSKLKSSKEKTYYPPPKEMASQLGTLIFSISKLSSKDMPGWKLGKKETRTLISEIIVGYRALDEENQGYEVMQTMFPHSARYLSQDDSKKLQVASNLADCFTRHEEDPTEVSFRVSNLEGERVYSLENSSTWPRAAVNEELESLLPATPYEEDDMSWEDPSCSLTGSGHKKPKSEYHQWLDLAEEEDTPETRQFYKQLLNEAATKRHPQPPSQQGGIQKKVADPLLSRSPDETASKEADPPSFTLKGLAQALTEVLPNSGNVLEQYRVDMEAKATKIKTLAALVLNSGTNFAMPDKDRGFPPIPGTDKGFEYINPRTGTADYNSKTALAVRFRDLDQVPSKQLVVVGNPCAKICVSCNSDVFERHIKKKPAPEKGAFNFGTWSQELRSSLVCVQNFKDWFCPSCPSTSEGSPILLPAPGAIWVCPGVKCGVTHKNPCDGVMNKCSHCTLSYGWGAVNPKLLRASVENRTPEAIKREAEEQRLAYITFGGSAINRAELDNVYNFGCFISLPGVRHSGCPGAPKCEFTPRVVKCLASCLFSQAGSPGGEVRDFQSVYRAIKPVTNITAEELYAAAYKAKWSDLPAPIWKGKLSDNLQIGLLESSFNMMRQVFVYAYGKNFQSDMDNAKTAYDHFINKDPDNWPADKREALINSIFSDYSRRVYEQQKNMALDQRYVWEKEGWSGEPTEEGMFYPIRPVCGYTLDYLTAIAEPMEQKHREMYAQVAFTPTPLKAKTGGGVEPESDEDEIKLNPKSGAASVPKESVSQQLAATQKVVKAQEAELTKLKEAEKTRKAKAKLHQEKREASRTGIDKTGSSGTRTEDIVLPPPKAEATVLPSPKARVKGGKGGKTGRNDKESLKEPSPSVSEQLPLALGREYAERGFDSKITDNQFSPVKPGKKGETDQRFCRAFNSMGGCPNHPLVKCPLLHERLPQSHWPLPDQWYFLQNGGHKDLEGKLSATKCKTLLSTKQLECLSTLPESHQKEFLLKNVATTLSNFGYQAGHHVPLTPIREGNGVSWNIVWPSENGPFWFSMGGQKVEEVRIAAIGKFVKESKNGSGGLLRGYLYNMGSHIELPGFENLGNCCVLKAISSLMFSPKIYANSPTKSSDFLLLQQMMEGLNKIELQVLIQNHNSTFAQLYVDGSTFQEEGLPDTIPLMWEKEGHLKRHCLLMICQDDQKSDAITLRLFIPIDLRKELWGNQTTAAALRSWVKHGLPGQHTRMVFAYPVLTICNLTTGERNNGGLRHAWAFPQMHSLAEVLELMAGCVDCNSAKVVVGAYGMHNYLKTCTSPEWSKKSAEDQIHKLTQAHKRVSIITQNLRAAVQAASEEEVQDHIPKPLKTTVAGPLTASKTGSKLKSEERAPIQSHEAEDTRDCVKCHKLWVAKSKNESQICDDCIWSDKCARQAASSDEWAVLYQKIVRDPEKSHPRFLRAHGTFTNDWYCFELGISNEATVATLPHLTAKQCIEALHRMVTALRTLWFGGRASKGPPMADIKAFFEGKLPPGHMEFLTELITQGGDPVFSGTGPGYEGRANLNATQEEEEVIRGEYANLVAAGKSLTFDISNPTIRELLIRGGVRFAPTFAIPKKRADGTIHPTKQRVIMDCRDACGDRGGHPKAVNTSLRSATQSTQKTTSTTRVISAALGEEKSFPHAALGGLKLDIASAFEQIALYLKSVGLMASSLQDGTCNILLVLPFGAKTSPGLWEVEGDAIIKSLWMTPRIDLRLTGANHPDCVRFVDDIMTLVAHHGYRPADHKSRLVDIIQKLFGTDGINLEKQGLEGTMENFKYAFGALLDLQRREVRVPGAKLKKAFNIAAKFLEGSDQVISCGEAQRLRGVLGSMTCWCPSMSALVLPRLDAITSNAAKANPGLTTPPSDFIASPAFRDEQGSETDAWESLRLCLDFFFRLASIRNGALMRVPFESGLPLLERLTFPGKETKESHTFVISDASRQAVAGFDMKTGKWFSQVRTKAEQEVFNSWATLNEDEQVSINQLENLANLFSALLLCPDHPGGLQCLIQDNTASENMQRRQTHRSRKDEQIGAIMSIVSLVLSTRMYGTRVDTKDNMADFFTRKKRTTEEEIFLRDFENTTGIKPTKVEIPPWLSSMGWERPKKGQDRFQYWYDQSLNTIDFLIEHHSASVKRFCPVPIEEIRAVLVETLEGAPLRKIEFTEDFPAQSGPSSQRSRLMDRAAKTTTTLLREAETLGEPAWKKRHGIEEGTSKLEAIDQVLEEEKREEHALLSVTNPKFQIEELFPLPSSKPATQGWLHELISKQKKAGVDKDCKFRLEKTVRLTTWFSGLGGIEEAALATGYVEVASFAENNPRLHGRLTGKYPEAQNFKDVAEYLSSGGRKTTGALLCASLPCVAYSAANPNRKGPLDPQFQGDLTNLIEIIHSQMPAIAAVECAPGINQRIKHGPSAMEIIQEGLPEYVVQAFILEGAEVTSPLTGEQSPSCKKTCILLLFDLKLFETIPISSLLLQKASPQDQFIQLLDLEGKFFPAFLQMPPEDMIDFEYDFQKTGPGQTAWVGEIHKAPKGLGEGGFPSKCMAPNLGPMGPYTAAGGGAWIAVECPSSLTSPFPTTQAGMRRVTPEEAARVKGLRGLDNTEDRKFMRENPAAAQRAVGNTPAQPVFDVLITQLLLHLYRVQKEGQSALDMWKARQEEEKDYPKVSFTGADNPSSKLPLCKTQKVLIKGETVAQTEKVWSRGVWEFWISHTKLVHPQAPRVVDAREELGQIYKQLDCVVCNEENPLHGRSKFCAICTAILVCWLKQEEERKATWVKMTIKECLPAMLGKTSKHKRTHWPGILVTIVTYNKSIAKNKPLPVGKKLESSIGYFTRMIPTGESRWRERNEDNCLLVHWSNQVPNGKRDVEDENKKLSFLYAKTKHTGSGQGTGLEEGSEPRGGSERELQKTDSTQDYPAPGKTGAGKRDPRTSKRTPGLEAGIQTISKKGRRRRRLPLTEKEIKDIGEFMDEVHLRGKDPKTMGKYSSSQRDWIQLFEQRGWDPLFFDCDTMSEKARRTLFYVAYEVQHQGLLGRSVRQKLSGIGWMFVKNFLPNPFGEMPALAYFFRHLASKEPKPSPKLPVCPSLLEIIMLHLDLSTIAGAALAASICAIYWALLRCGEYAGETETYADSDRVVCWRDLILRKHLGPDSPFCSNTDFGEAEVLTIRIRSGKNVLHTCTRTITKTKDCAICAVSAIQNLHRVIFKTTGAYPRPEEALCKVKEGRWISREQISEVLKAGMRACGCNSDRTASHSLRRGGASAYYCAGVPMEDIKIFGRWLSDSYKLYIFLSGTNSIMSKGNVHPTMVVPRFEKN